MDAIMANITVRNLSDDIHRALKLRAAQHGRSTEAEVREILAAAVQPKAGMGTALAAVGRRLEFSDRDVDGINALRARSRVQPDPLSFESESAESKRAAP